MNRSRSAGVFLVVSAMTVAFAWGTVTVAHAVDGVTLINQSKALAGGVTAGDSPGFPVTITRAGSFRLSGNLVVPNANTSGIVIDLAAPGVVTLDMNGFSIIGPAHCDPFTHVCTNTGSGVGIATGNTAILSVSRGTVIGMGGDGIAGFEVSVDRVRAWSNGGTGFNLGFRCRIQDSEALRNGAGGIFAGPGCVVRDNVVADNGGIGIEGAVGALVRGNAVTANKLFGLSISAVGCIDNAVSGNNSFGIQIQAFGAAIPGCNLLGLP
jgi:hypothetical protein